MTSRDAGADRGEACSLCNEEMGQEGLTIAADYNYGQITSAWVKRYVEANGGQVLSTDFFPLDVTNFGPTIEKIQSAKPDLVMSVLVGASHLGFYRQWASAGLKNQIPIASTTFGAGGTEPILITPGKQRHHLLLRLLSDHQFAANKAFIAKVGAKVDKFFGGKMPLLTELSVCTYEGCMMWAAGVKKAGTIDRIKVIEALESDMSFDDFPSGKVTIDPKPTTSSATSTWPTFRTANSSSWRAIRSSRRRTPRRCATS